ncbi:sensor histidine kinase [Desulfogranum mediterraneum]|uniref:sensor histidine kinase n=1 Tax=Desulfogranum mediterraneum TaxID=160661 RepID=UPI00040D4931|nr:ATP-binding protein [Desulfogranum mediterraneum]
MKKSASRFDRQFTLKEIFSVQKMKRIEQALSALLGCQVVLLDLETVPDPDAQHVEILWELEPIAYLASPSAQLDQLRAGAELILILLKEAVQYRMASELHLETIASDYEVLQEKHRELQKSEQRYRELSGRLEEKVAQQVKILEEAQRKIYQSEKLASVGQLAAGVAHELNSPLAFIQHNLTAAKDYLQSLDLFFTAVLHGRDLEAVHDAWEEEDIDFIRTDFPVLFDSCLDGVKRLSSIISDLKVFSNINREHLTRDDVNRRLQTVLAMLKPQIGKEVELVVKFSDLPEIYCYPSYLGQVFYNLIQNGIQAIEGKGKVTITTFASQDEVCISVGDTGIGIKEEHLARIFEPFFTTKEVGQGTGLGLSVIHDIVQAHQGTVEVQSEPDKGSVFTISLPVDPEINNSRGHKQRGGGQL